MGLGEMYVGDPRFTVNSDVHAEGTAEPIGEAMRVHADRHLSWPGRAGAGLQTLARNPPGRLLAD
ncbi:MAG: MerR family transcriptional regulator [Naasia sp.]|nr:MerR family transcriptional regulator [Naasia sp.]